MGKNYNIMLEGCDGVGKSTLALEIAKINKPSILVHNVAVNSYEEGFELNTKLVTLLNSMTGLVMDRGLLSEAVYAPIYRRYYPEYMHSMEQKLNTNNYLVLLKTDLTTLLAENKQDDMVKKDKLAEILEAYDIQYSASKFPNKMIIDSRKYSPLNCATKLLEMIENDRQVR